MVENTMILKCYYVHDGEYGVLVHAESPSKAKSLVYGTSLTFEDYEYTELRCRRMPKLDSLPLNLENSKMVLSWSDDDDCSNDDYCPFDTDEDYWREFMCRCPICEKYREKL